MIYIISELYKRVLYWGLQHILLNINKQLIIKMKNKSAVYTIAIIIAVFAGIFIFVSIKEPYFLKSMIRTGGIYWFLGIFAAVIIIAWIVLRYTAIGKMHDDLSRYAKEISKSSKTMEKGEFKEKIKSARNEFFKENKALVITGAFFAVVFVILLIWYFQIPSYQAAIYGDPTKSYIKIMLYLIAAFMFYLSYKFTKTMAEKTRKT